MEILKIKNIEKIEGFAVNYKKKSFILVKIEEFVNVYVIKLTPTPFWQSTSSLTPIELHLLRRGVYQHGKENPICFRLVQTGLVIPHYVPKPDITSPHLFIRHIREYIKTLPDANY